jgi:hypothetical protein
MKEHTNNNIRSGNLLSIVKDMDRFEQVVPQRHLAYGILHFLVWEAHASRLFLEVLFVTISYHLIYMYLGVQGYLPLPLSLHLAILGCFALVVLFIDTQILCKSNGIYRRAYVKSYSGNLDRAIDLLHRANGTNLPPSPSAFHLAASEFHLISGSRNTGDSALENALRTGANPFECLYIRMRSILFSGCYKDCFKGISEQLENSPLLQFEYGVSLLVDRDSRGDAKKYFNKIVDVPSVMHPSGAESHDLAHLMLTCIELHSGKAEEALKKLQVMFELVVPELKIFPALRPYVSLAYLERAKYYSAKVKFKDRARFDVERALSLCAYPLHKNLAKSLAQSC